MIFIFPPTALIFSEYLSRSCFNGSLLDLNPLEIEVFSFIAVDPQAGFLQILLGGHFRLSP